MRVVKQLQYGGCKNKLLAVRLDEVPNLRKNSINYVLKALTNDNIGNLHERKDFLAIRPKLGTHLSKLQ